MDISLLLSSFLEPEFLSDSVVLSMPFSTSLLNTTEMKFIAFMTKIVHTVKNVITPMAQHATLTAMEWSDVSFFSTESDIADLALFISCVSFNKPSIDAFCSSRDSRISRVGKGVN